VPLLLDLFCGAGGAAMGYHRAGFRVIGVDIKPQPRYPFEFYQEDALDYLAAALRYPLSFPEFAAVHASPPCQAYIAITKGTNQGREYPKLIEPTRELLRRMGLPYVIENGVRWPLREPMRLCGETFGLRVIRHRFFESNALIMEPPHVPHRGRVAGYRHGENFDGPYFAVYGDGGGKGSIDDWRGAMGIDWMQTKHELRESIPPAYTQYIGEQLLQAIGVAA
jgi:hypothetical protein